MTIETVSTPPPNDGPPRQTFRGRAIRASAFTLGGYATSQILRIGSNMVLTRLLFPEAFGLMALVQVILTGLEMISDIGIQPSIVQHDRGDDADFLNTAWTLQVIRGLVLWVCGMLIAAPFAWFYGEPQLVQLLPAATATAALAGLNSTKLATLNRRMQIGPMVLIDLAAQLAAIATMIGIALVYRSVWALVVGGIVAASMKMVLSHAALSGIHNRFRWEAEASRAIVHFGKWIFLSTLVTFLAMRLDILLLGRLVPIELLGVYSIAGLLSMLPQQIGNRLAVAVLFPALASAERESRERLRARLRQARSVILPAVLLLVLAIAVLAPPFFYYLYDERYHAAGWMAQLLMVSMWFLLLHHFTARTLLAVGDSKSLAVSNMLRFACAAAGCLGGFQLAGLPGLILGLGVGALIGYLALQVAMLRHGLSIASEDLRYSLTGLVLGLLGGLGPRLAGPLLADVDRGLIELGFAAIILPPVALFAALRARRLYSPST
jgi:O-antigen/teichoic acid export membrane protein